MQQPVPPSLGLCKIFFDKRGRGEPALAILPVSRLKEIFLKKGT